MSELPSCSECQSALTYPDGDMLVCPECAYEWSATAGQSGSEVSGIGAMKLESQFVRKT